MAKPTSRSAARNAAKKKSTALSSGKTAQATSRKPAASKARAAVVAKPRRPKQRIAISHYRDEDFRANGLRAYAHYRDLGIASATHGLAQAHV